MIKASRKAYKNKSYITFYNYISKKHYLKNCLILKK